MEPYSTCACNDCPMLRMAMTGIKAAIAAAWNGSLYMDSKAPFLGHIISDSEDENGIPQPDSTTGHMVRVRSPISRFDGPHPRTAGSQPIAKNFSLTSVRAFLKGKA